jgi:enoyl-[acyl-carrier-protein] reductase (NADH)
LDVSPLNNSANFGDIMSSSALEVLEKGNTAVDKLKAEGAISIVSSLVVDMDSDQTLLSAVTDIEKRFGKLDVLVVSIPTRVSLR